MMLHAFKNSVLKQQEETFQQIYVPFANNIFKTICLMQKL